MKIIFFGTPEFAAGILETLSTSGQEICAVVTRPDRPVGRNLRVRYSPVKEFVVSHMPNVPLLQPEKASDEAFCRELKTFCPDLFLVVAYGEIMKNNVLQIPPLGCVNIHASLLPEYRGAAPIERCIMGGKTVSGVTFMEMVLQMDAGAVLKRCPVPVPEEMTGGELREALLQTAKEALPEFLSHYQKYYAKREPQDGALVSFAPKITPEDSILDWMQPARSVYNRIRALSPSPGTFVRFRFGEESKRVKILGGRILNDPPEKPGTLLVTKNRIAISCLDAWLELTILHPEGKKVLRTEEFLRGVSKHFTLES